MPVWLSALALAATPAPQPCSFETAIPTDVRTLARDPEKWFGRCVSLDGYVTHNVFYEDVAGLYRRAASDKGDRPNDGWLGLYFRSYRDWQKRLRRADIVGIVDSCGRIYAAAEASLGPNEIVFVTGYCHYTGGQILRRVATAYGGHVRFTRQTGERKRADFGDLVPAPGDNPVPSEVRDKVEAWRSAFHAGNVATLKTLVSPYDWTVEQQPKAAGRLVAVLSGARGPFRSLRGLRPDPVYFNERRDREQLADGEKGDWFACFCKSSDCSRSWPIAAMDAKALESRPYACLRVYQAVDGSNALELGLESEGNGLIEPRHP